MGLPFPELSAEEAAAQINHGQTVAFSGFTPAGSPKAIPSAIAANAEAAHQRGEPFKIGVVTGASSWSIAGRRTRKSKRDQLSHTLSVQCGSSRPHQRRRHTFF